MKWEELIRKLEDKRRELQLEEPEKIKSLSERFQERAARLKEISEKSSVNYKRSKKIFISFNHRIEPYKVVEEAASQEKSISIWEKYEIWKRREAAKVDKIFIREELRRIRGKGYNSQGLEILLNNSDRSNFIKWLETRNTFKQFLEVGIKLEDFILSLEYSKEYLDLLIYKINNEEFRVMLA